MEKLVLLSTVFQVLSLGLDEWGVETNSYIGLKYHIIYKDNITNAYFVPSGNYNQRYVNIVKFLVYISLGLHLLAGTEYRYILLASGIMSVLASLIWYAKLRTLVVDRMRFNFRVGTSFLLNTLSGIINIICAIKINSI